MAIELIVTVAVLALVFALSLFAFSLLRSSSALSEAHTTMVGMLYDARARTLAAESNTVYGVHLDRAFSQATLFQGPSYAGSSLREVYALNAAVAIQSISGPQDIIFSRLSGTTTPATITLQLNANPSQTDTITIFSTGSAQ